jgi:endonuclease/exonuclease/phosphatase family metal-dependent hydrolase
MAELRFMTWNVQNLFDTGNEDGPDAQDKLAAKIESLRAVIDQHNPHVVALQEVGGEQALERLQAVLTIPMPHRAVGVPDGRGIRVGFISRLVLLQRVDIQSFPAGLLPIQAGDDPPGPDGPRMMHQMGRGGLQVTVRVNNLDVHIITAHLKSKLLTFPSGFSPANEDQRARFGAYALYRRASEATTLRDHLNGLLAGSGEETAVVLGGDMNDEVDAATTQILNGPGGSEIGTVGFNRPDRGDGDRMWNLAPLIPEEQRFSRIYRGRRELIDHIFTSHFLANNNHVAKVTTAIAEGALPSIDDNPNTRQGEPGSDHSAVIATFDF